MSRALIPDTNVLVSAALKPESDLSRIVEKVLLRQAPLYGCPSIVAEYREVLNRSKFRPKVLTGNVMHVPIQKCALISRAQGFSKILA